MYITEIVLDKFKSFGRKTRIPFYENFTTVAGPNGSGKSNVIDAVLFTLGLARTSGIRAEKLTDLIYNPGHQNGESFEGEREASVTVIFDNSERTLSRTQVVNAAGSEKIGDVDEIAIKRRIKETDEHYYSYYYINGRSVNLSDIQELLGQAGIAPEGYNVVMQGDVTEIINMTATSRRAIIDEIAGVAEFDAKKADANEELAVVEDRIDDVALRIEEKAERLEQLEDERETALQYRQLREEKETYEEYRQAAKLEAKRDSLATVEAEIDETTAERERHQSTLDERQEELTRVEAELEELNDEIEHKGEDEQLALKREIEEIKGDIARIDDRIESREAEVEAAETDRRQAYVKIDSTQEEIDELETEIRETKVTKSSVVAEIEDAQDRLAETEARIDEVGAEFEEVKDQLQDRKKRLEAAKAEKKERQREQDRLLDEARRRSNERRETEAAIEEAREEVSALETAVEDLETERQKAAQNHATAAEAVDELRAGRTELRDTVDEIEDELTAAQQEYAELEATASQAGDSSYGRAVTTVLNAGFDGVHGTVAQLGRVEEQYATACETAAGGRMANVVVDTDRVGQECIEHLKARNAGRATFLPLTEMDDRGLSREPNRPGVIGFAAELVSFDDEYAGVFSYVLGSTLVVETIETARALMGEYRLVTLEGELVERSGAMTGGSNGGSRYSFAGSSGKLERVAERVERLESERRSLREELRETEDQLESARDKASTAADQVREIEATIESREAEIAATRDRIDELETTLADIEAEREQVAEQMDELEAEIATTNETIASLKTEIEELEAEIEGSALPSLTAQAESIREETDDLETRRDELDACLSELELEKQYAEESIEDLQTEINAADEQIETATDAIATLETERSDREAQLEEKNEAVAALEDELAELKTERDVLRERVDDARADRDTAQEQVAATEDELATQRETRERLEWEIDELAAEVGAYDPATVPDRKTVTAELNRLEGEMAALEPVNMLAIEEYDEVQETLEQLRERKQTLIGEANAIRDRISKYEAQKKGTFMESFEAIDRQFQRIFERLSNGTGQLHLESEDDPFDGGLTMKAQPGDKPIQRLDAMSGGEKSLTALAFIFAIQRHNPAPFYALDEVDAFLDAANADLVGELVDELAGEAQFIVVSHRSKMLERSERAIGVTMQENNISTVTGIDLSGPGEAPADD